MIKKILIIFLLYLAASPPPSPSSFFLFLILNFLLHPYSSTSSFFIHFITPIIKLGFHFSFLLLLPILPLHLSDGRVSAYNGTAGAGERERMMREMVGNNEEEERERKDCAFEWDNDSQLYYHASSGFYYDSIAGWYFSTRDGLYYKFENGSYVPFESDQERDYTELQQLANVTDGIVQYRLLSDEPVQDYQCKTECISNNEPANPPPPSEWLEETLIDLYLTGYSNSGINGADDHIMSMESDGGHDSALLDHVTVNDTSEEQEEGEWIMEELQDEAESSGRVADEGISQEEENWQAQYGQVIESGEEGLPAVPIIDLWDWAMVAEIVDKKKCGKRKKYQVARLVGKLVKPSTKLHPSMPSGGVLFKTATIRQVHHALVRVSTGQVYRLKSPSLKYLASLSAYDSSNPTKDWGFPDLSMDKLSSHASNYSESCGNETGLPVSEDTSALTDQNQLVEKNKNCAYRDRAAERRALHGGFGVGPGQKNLGIDGGMAASPVSDSTEEAAAAALNMSFGAGSYARKLLGNMGWKEGEALGKTVKGLTQPLEAVGNKGYAGLGWCQSRLEYS